MLYLTANLVGRAKRVTEMGREIIVKPMTLIVPGVPTGSNGPILYPPEEITKDPTAWNGVPLTVYHPFKDGRPVSARERPSIGTVRNARADSNLTAEGWFDVERTGIADARVLRALEMGEPVELSTGLFLDHEPSSGTHNGRHYGSIARNFKPDHVAVLPDQVGACSLRDGCGVHNHHLEVNMTLPNPTCCKNPNALCFSCWLRQRAQVQNAIVLNKAATVEPLTLDDLLAEESPMQTVVNANPGNGNACSYRRQWRICSKCGADASTSRAGRRVNADRPLSDKDSEGE